jgi:glucose/arabinose dehydrogenase
MDGRFLNGIRACALFACSQLVAGCGEFATLSVDEGSGPSPQLPPPKRTLIPTLKIAPAVHWAAGETPTPAAGLAVNAFATGLDHPRWVYVLPNGDVLVSETNAPDRPAEGKGLRAKIQKAEMKKAGAVTPSANRITLLRDADGDGIAETRHVFASDLHSPFGMTLVGNTLYVADTDAIVRFPYRSGETHIGARPERLVELPAGPRNHHWTKNVIASTDGRRLYASVGSNSNVGDHGMEIEANRAAILEVDPATGNTSLYASGLRNPNGMGWNPVTGELWTAVNERDEIGSDLVPDYITSVKRGGFYGWPYSYYGQHVDVRMKPQRPDLVAKAIVPDFAVGPHTASIGFAFYQGGLLPAHYANGAFVGQHGSWNRRPPSGYRVIFVPFANGKPSGPVEEVLGGFLDAEGNARGRPVGVAVGKDGSVLVADDVGNAVWRVTPAPATAAK